MTVRELVFETPYGSGGCYAYVGFMAVGATIKLSADYFFTDVGLSEYLLRLGWSLAAMGWSAWLVSQANTFAQQDSRETRLMRRSGVIMSSLTIAGVLVI